MCFSAHSISGGGGGGAVPFRPIQSVGVGVGACMLTFITRVPFSPKRGGGGGGGGGGKGTWPPPPGCRPCLLGVCSAGALQALPMVLMLGHFYHT